MVEMLVVVFIVLLTLLGIIQFALIYNAKSVLNYATYEAARSAALNYGSPDAMKFALAQKLAALRQSDMSQTGALNSAFERLQNSQQLMIDEIDSGGDVCIERISPTPLSGHWQSVGGGGSLYSQEIPNDHLLYRSNAPDSQERLSIQDANLIKIKVTYCHPMIVPLIKTSIQRLMLQNYAIRDPDPVPGWEVPNTLQAFEKSCYERGRMPIQSQAVARMQTPIRNYTFPAFCN